MSSIRGGFETRLAVAAEGEPVEYPVDVSALSEPAWKMVVNQKWIRQGPFGLWYWNIERVTRGT